ncbi:MAG: cupin domain-containing protein [Bacteroidetes bacterium]|nr:cupin domain-containing protein [Bacteroidota bacterium]
MQPYNEPGILEEYCLGLLPPHEAAAITLAAQNDADLQQRILAIENTLLQYKTLAVQPALKNSIWETLQQLPAEQAIDLSDPPLINRNSNLQQWANALQQLEPDTAFGPMNVRFLKNTPTLQLCVAWLNGELDEAEHHADEFAESFFILEGSCECNIGGQIIHLKAGDYLDIPFNTHHTIKATSAELGYVKAIIQRRKPAA